tara:strand:- start:7 stop:504 length:498 start_codon:yes stop_codon:yes gene_type:complete
MIIEFTDPQIWVAIAFILFFVLFGKMVWKKLSSFLDGKILEINNEINEAQNIHRQAKELLEVETKRMQDLELKIKKIVDDSKNKSYDLAKETQKKLANQISLLEKDSLEKIKVLKNQAQENIKLNVINKASNIAETVLENKLTEQYQKETMQESVNQLKKVINQI